jgi:uncharacterized protein YebE (UPF0316 family)
VLTWLVVIRQVKQNLNNPVSYIAYAAGFATGNLFGMHLQSRLAIGHVIVRFLIFKAGHELVT